MHISFPAFATVEKVTTGSASCKVALFSQLPYCCVLKSHNLSLAALTITFSTVLCFVKISFTVLLDPEISVKYPDLRYLVDDTKSYFHVFRINHPSVLKNHNII